MTEFVEKFEQVEAAWDLHLKGYKDSEIAARLGVSRTVVKNLIADGKKIVQDRIDEDPDFLSRVHENTIQAMDEIDLLLKEGWETLEYCKQQEMANQQVNAIKVIQGLVETKARLLSLLGSNVDGTNILQMRKLERVNEIVSSVIKEVVANCEHCRVEAQMRLAEAFRIMEREDEIIHMQPEPVLQLPVAVDEDEVDEEIMTDILNREE